MTTEYQALHKKENRGALKEGGYRILPERWVKYDKVEKILKMLKRAGAITSKKDMK